MPAGTGGSFTASSVPRATGPGLQNSFLLEGGSFSTFRGAYTLTAPIGGRVTAASIQAGGSVDGTTAPYVIDAANRYEAVGQLPERLVGTVRPGMSILIEPGIAGRVTAVGSAVTHVKKGDLVINLQRENWAQKRRVKGDDAIPLPAGIDLRQAAMVRINPPTAQLMLQDFVDLKPGDSIGLKPDLSAVHLFAEDGRRL